MKANSERIIELFSEAMARPSPDERVRFLAEACRDEPEVREQVESLLRAEEPARDFLKQPPPGTGSAVVLDMEKPGDRVGRYKLLEKIGEGGCGVVYLAEQEEPVRRRVALKVIKLGMDTRQVVARFEAERQALALMDHPNIAKVHDGGATDTGRPYFVMELVRGLRITEYCDQNHLSTAERLKLFAQVCQAIQHAHQKGIIHRDIKPSNILVTVNDGPAAAGCPKVIDFGIAKAIDQRLTDKSYFTAFQAFIGTPAYTSPEQAEMSSLDIDTRSDIYSLGVLLYELLTGQTPFDTQELMKAGLDEMRRIIREEEPAKPSTRLTQELITAWRARSSPSPPAAGGEGRGEEGRRVGGMPPHPSPLPLRGGEGGDARRLQPEQKELINLLRGDLDWIVMKCLEKDRARRYQTANGLAADLQRHLNHETVLARPASTAYRFGKLVHRNKLAFASATAVAGALVLGAVVSTWQAFEASKARDAEKQERRRAERGELDARQRAYASDMNLAQQALAQNNLGRAQELLNRHRPSFGVPALAGSVQSRDPANRLKAGLQTDLRGWEWRYLWQQCQSDALFTLCQKSNSIFSLTVSFDGKWLAVGEQDEGRLSIWDLPKREEIMRFPADEGPVLAVFSPHARLLAFSSGSSWPSGNQQRRVQLWDGDTQRIVTELPLDDPCRGLAFSGDGETLATLSAGTIAAGREGHLTLWKVPEGTRLARHVAGRIRWHGGSPFAVAPDSSVAAYALGTDSIRVVDLLTGQERWSHKFPDDLVTALAISPDGKTLASGAGLGPSAIRLWDLASGDEIAVSQRHLGHNRALVFSSDGKTLASGSSDQTICLWNTAGLNRLRLLQGHKGEIESLALLPDNRTLVSGGKDGSVLVWDTGADGRASPHVKLSEHLIAWSFATNNQTVLTCDRQGRVAQWQGNYLAEERLFEMGANVAQAAFLPQHSIVLARLESGKIQVWDLRRRTFSRELPLSISPPPRWLWMAQGNRLIIGGLASETLHEFDLTTWQKVQAWPGPAQLFTGALSPDGRSCITLGYGGASMTTDLSTGRTSPGNLEIRDASDATFSADGKLLAAATHRGFARIWDAATQRRVVDLSGFLQGVHSVAFSPDGQRLVTGSDEKEAIKLWDVKGQQELLTLEGQGTMFFPTAFSPDGAVLGSMNANGILHLWRAPSWAEIEAAENAEAVPTR